MAVDARGRQRLRHKVARWRIAETPQGLRAKHRPWPLEVAHEHELDLEAKTEMMMNMDRKMNMKMEMHVKRKTRINTQITIHIKSK